MPAKHRPALRRRTAARWRRDPSMLPFSCLPPRASSLCFAVTRNGTSAEQKIEIARIHGYRRHATRQLSSRMNNVDLKIALNKKVDQMGRVETQLTHR